MGPPGTGFSGREVVPLLSLSSLDACWQFWGSPRGWGYGHRVPVVNSLCSVLPSGILSGSWPCTCRRLSPGRNWGLCWKGTLGSGWKAGLDVGLL